MIAGIVEALEKHLELLPKLLTEKLKSDEIFWEMVDITITLMVTLLNNANAVIKGKKAFQDFFNILWHASETTNPLLNKLKIFMDKRFISHLRRHYVIMDMWLSYLLETLESSDEQASKMDLTLTTDQMTSIMTICCDELLKLFTPTIDMMDSAYFTNTKDRFDMLMKLISRLTKVPTHPSVAIPVSEQVPSAWIKVINMLLSIVIQRFTKQSTTLLEVENATIEEILPLIGNIIKCQKHIIHNCNEVHPYHNSLLVIVKDILSIIDKILSTNQCNDENDNKALLMLQYALQPLGTIMHITPSNSIISTLLDDTVSPFTGCWLERLITLWLHHHALNHPLVIIPIMQFFQSIIAMNGEANTTAAINLLQTATDSASLTIGEVFKTMLTRNYDNCDVLIIICPILCTLTSGGYCDGCDNYGLHNCIPLLFDVLIAHKTNHSMVIALLQTIGSSLPLINDTTLCTQSFCSLLDDSSCNLNPIIQDYKQDMAIVSALIPVLNGLSCKVHNTIEWLSGTICQDLYVYMLTSPSILENGALCSNVLATIGNVWEHIDIQNKKLKICRILCNIIISKLSSELTLDAMDDDIMLSSLQIINRFVNANNIDTSRQCEIIRLLLSKSPSLLLQLLLHYTNKSSDIVIQCYDIFNNVLVTKKFRNCRKSCIVNRIMYVKHIQKSLQMNNLNNSKIIQREMLVLYNFMVVDDHIPNVLNRTSKYNVFIHGLHCHRSDPDTVESILMILHRMSVVSERCSYDGWMKEQRLALEQTDANSVASLLLTIWESSIKRKAGVSILWIIRYLNSQSDGIPKAIVYMVKSGGLLPLIKPTWFEFMHLTSTHKAIDALITFLSYCVVVIDTDSNVIDMEGGRLFILTVINDVVGLSGKDRQRMMSLQSKYSLEIAYAFVEKTARENNDLPNELMCPITMKLMMDPVILRDGHTYERKAIERWLKKENRSPKTNQALETKDVLPNYLAKALIDGLVAKYTDSGRNAI